jgi:hypothetical protein
MVGQESQILGDTQHAIEPESLVEPQYEATATGA